MIDITKIKILSKKIKSRLSIALVSDLHNREYREIVEIIKRESPDFIAVTGDFSNRYTKKCEKGLEFFKVISKKYPVFVSLGNHDTEILTKADFEKIKESGAFLLDNEFIKYNEIFIGGLTSNKNFSDHEFLKDFADNEAFKLLLCHHPEYYNMFLKNYAFDLILAGHAHGGQIRLPLIGGIFAPGQGLFPRLTSGLNMNKIIVSRGLGNPNRLPRWFNNPEIIFIEIRRYSK